VVVAIAAVAAIVLAPAGLAIVLPARLTRTLLLDPFGRFIDASQTNAFVLFVVFSACVLIAIRRARAGDALYIRPIAGLAAVDEAIGRATEMGRKILYVPGIQSMDEIQTIASLAFLGHVARKTALYGAALDVPNRDPLTYAAARETVRQAYLESARPDAWSEGIVNYVTYDQWALTAAVTGRMIREKPAAHFFVGAFYAESLMLAEVGQTTGAMQIAATAEIAQIPFFVCACDYTLIGEEFYAASAYLSREPMLLGSTKGQDWVKFFVIGWLVAGAGLIAAAALFPGSGPLGALAGWMTKVLG
jgi:hypothetical protein